MTMLQRNGLIAIAVLLVTVRATGQRPSLKDKFTTQIAGELGVPAGGGASRPPPSPQNVIQE